MCCSSVLGGPSDPASCVSFGRRGACPPARRPRREPSARRVVSKPGQALPPPTGTAARPSGLSGALHTSGACCAEDDSPRLEARPGPATADQHRGLAPPPPTGTLAGPTAPLAPRPGPPFPPTLSCGVRVLDSLLTYPDCCFLSSLVVFAGLATCLLCGSGGLHYMKPPGGVLSAYRSLVSCNSPCLRLRGGGFMWCNAQTADHLGEKH